MQGSRLRRTYQGAERSSALGSPSAEKINAQEGCAAAGGEGNPGFPYP